jgi:hypothetical protein
VAAPAAPRDHARVRRDHRERSAIVKSKRERHQVRDERYQPVMGRLAAEGLDFALSPVPPSREPIAVEDALWAAEFEPRLAQALPALVLKRRSMFESVRSLPKELAAAVSGLKEGQPVGFLGQRGAVQKGWLDKLERGSRGATRLKAFRFTAGDEATIKELADELSLSETDVVRHALRVLAASLTR